MNNGANRGNEIKNKLAKKAVTAAGGPVAGKALDIADKLGKKNGNADLLNQQNAAANPQEENEQTENTSSSTADSGTSSNNKKNENPKNALTSAKEGLRGNSNAKGEYTGYGDIIFSALKKHWKIIASVAASFFFLLFFIILVVIIVSSVGGGVIEFFTKVGDAVVGYFHVDEEKRTFQYYEKLEKVQNRVFRKKNVCIDVNLITATLTVDLDAAGYVKQSYEDTKELEDSEEGLFPITESGASDGWEGFIDDSYDFEYISEYEDQDEKYKKMTKEIELLANMQIKTVKYGHNKKLKNNGEGVVIPVDKHGNPKLAVNYANKCWAEDSEYEDEPVSEETLEDFDLPGFDAWTNWRINGDFTSDSAEKVAMHDKRAFHLFFSKKAKDETNYQFTIYNPKIETSCDDETGECEQVCNWRLPKNRYELSIGDLNTMEESVYYWNLVNSFIPNYYDEYLPDGGPEREEAIKGIAELIYLLYNDLGPGETCGNTLIKFNPNYNFACISDSSVSTGTSTSNVKVRLLDNSGNDLGEELVDIEEYIMGVVYAEDFYTPNVEAMKAQAVAARTYLMGMNNIEMDENGNKIISIKNSQSNQVYCNPYTGCYNDIGTSNPVTHSTQLPNTSPYKRALNDSELELLRSVINDTLGEVMYDSEGNLLSVHYDSDIQGSWNDMQGSDYLSILAATYSDMASVDSDCIGSPYEGGGYFGDGSWGDWKQGNGPWADMIVGYDRNGDPITFGSIGCYVTSMFNLIAVSGVPTVYGSGAGIDYEAIVRDLINSRQFSNGGNFSNNWDYINSHILQGGSLQQQADYTANNDNVVSKTNAYQSEGKYVQIHVKRFNGNSYSQHFVAAEATEGGDIIIHDSGRSYTRLSQYLSSGWYVEDVRAYIIQ